MTKTKKSMLITVIVLLVVFLIIGIILGCLLPSGYSPGNMCIYYKELSTVMNDNIVYISNEFCQENQLSIVGIQRGMYMGEPYDEIIGEVEISYNRKSMKNSADYYTLAQNLESISYSFSSKEDSDLIPVDIRVFVFTKKNKDVNYEYEYGGYQYTKEDLSVNEKRYEIKTTPKKRAICRLYWSISISKDVADNYTEEEKNARIEQIFKSAVDNIVYYDEL